MAYTPRKPPRLREQWHWAGDELLDGTLTALEIAVYGVLTMHADAVTQEAWPSKARIAACIRGASYADVERALFDLKRKGRLRIGHKPTGRDRKTREVYTLVEPGSLRPDNPGLAFLWDNIYGIARVWAGHDDRALLDVCDTEVESYTGDTLRVSVPYAWQASRLRTLAPLLEDAAEHLLHVPVEVRLEARLEDRLKPAPPGI